MTDEEIDAIDPAFIDSVTGDRLLAELRRERARGDHLADGYASYVHAKITLWLACIQDEPAEAAAWVSADVEEWIDAEDIANDPWAHDWRKFWRSRDPFSYKPAKTCGVCGAPATTWGQHMAACGTRHWKALKGELRDEQCRLCNEVTVCAHDLAGSPVCADCWPGERLLADARAAWRRQVLGEDPTP